MLPESISRDRELPSTWRVFAMAALAVLMIAVAACSSSEPIVAERDAPEPLPTAIPTPSSQGPNGEAMSLEVVDFEDLAIITDGNGMAVYGNENDTIDTIFCNEADCTRVWVPLAPRDAFISSRLDAELFQVITRPDGTEQVAYDGTPLYTWTGDSIVGYPGGAGVAGIWFGLTAGGERVVAN